WLSPADPDEDFRCVVGQEPDELSGVPLVAEVLEVDDDRVRRLRDVPGGERLEADAKVASPPAAAQGLLAEEGPEVADSELLQVGNLRRDGRVGCAAVRPEDHNGSLDASRAERNAQVVPGSLHVVLHGDEDDI